MKYYIIDGTGTKRSAKKVKCDYCSVEFLKSKIQLRKTKNNYCCHEHSTLASRTSKRIKVICAYCSKEKEIPEKQYNTSKTKTFFCNRNHQSIAQKADSNINYFAFYKHGLYKNGNDDSIHRLLAFDYYPCECECCGYNVHVKILEVHHIDGNKNNNNIENLIILCPNCHAAITRKYAVLENRKMIWVFS